MNFRPATPLGCPVLQRPPTTPFKNGSRCWFSPGTGAPWCGCHRRGRCRSHPPRPVCCVTRSCPGSARPSSASAAPSPGHCPQRSSGSATLETSHSAHLCPRTGNSTAVQGKTSVLCEAGNRKLFQRQTAIKSGKCFQFEVLSRLAAITCFRSQAYTDKSGVMHPGFSTSYTITLIQEYITYRRHTRSQLPCCQYLWAPVWHFQLPWCVTQTAPTPGEQPHPHKWPSGDVYTPPTLTKGKRARSSPRTQFLSVDTNNLQTFRHN